MSEHTESHYERLSKLTDGHDMNLNVGLSMMCRLLDQTTMDYDTRERIHEGVINQLNSRRTKDAEANARLIAAAPDMTDLMKIDFRGSLWNVRPRILWQSLFNFYRQQGCPLDHLDNMLIDLRNCTEVFDKLTNNQTVEFLWGCNPGHSETTWIAESSFEGYSIEVITTISAFDYFVLCEVSGDEAKFTEVTGDTKLPV